MWVTDTQGLWRDAYVCMAMIAAATETVHIGPMVTNVTTRHPTVTASAMATVAELSHGRAILGIGSGRSSVRLLGRREARLATIRDDVNTIRSLLRGDTVAFGDGTFELAPGLAPSSIPIDLSGSGPRMLQLAGEIGDGVVFVVGATPALAAYAHAEIDRGIARRDPSLGLPYRIHYVQCALAATTAEATDQGRAMAGFQLAQLTVPKSNYTSERYLGTDYDYRAHYSSANRVRDTVSDEQVREVVACGDRDTLTEQLTSLTDGGIDQLTVYPCGDMDEFIAACATNIVPVLRERTSAR